MTRVLCLSAHPDDVEVYMGGALLGFCAQDWDVLVWIATHGEKGRLQPQAGTRVDESRTALGSLGCRMQVEGLEDGALARSPDLERILRDRIAEERPDLLFAPHRSDRHVDHAAIGTCVAGIEIARERPVWHWLDAAPVCEPSHFLDLGGSLAAKLALIGYHKSQIPGPGGRRDHLPEGRDLLQRALHRDRGYGIQLGRPFVEPFLASGPRAGDVPCILESVQGFVRKGSSRTGGSS